MEFDAAFAHDVLVPLNAAIYQLSEGRELKLPLGWQQTDTIIPDESIQKAASGWARGLVARRGDTLVIAMCGIPNIQWMSELTSCRSLTEPG